MKVTKRSPKTGKWNTMDLPITVEQWNKWKGGELIQRAMPHLNDDQREFLVSGCYGDDFKTLFGDGKDDDRYSLR